MTSPATYRIVLFNKGQALPFGMTLSSLTAGECAPYARLAMQLHDAERAEILDGSGNMVDMLLEPDDNPYDDRSSTDWGDIVLPTGDGRG